jgi:hypothetical protein
MGKESPLWMAEMLAMWQAMEAILRRYLQM